MKFSNPRFFVLISMVIVKSKSETAKIWLNEHKIVHVEMLPEAQLKLEHAKKNLSIIINLVKGEKHLHFIDVRNMKKMSREAISYVSSKTNYAITSAMAIFVSSSSQKVIGNIVTKIMRPTFPTRLFTDKDKAYEWLKQFEPEHSLEPTM